MMQCGLPANSSSSISALVLYAVMRSKSIRYQSNMYMLLIGSLGQVPWQSCMSQALCRRTMKDLVVKLAHQSRGIDLQIWCLMSVRSHRAIPYDFKLRSDLETGNIS